MTAVLRQFLSENPACFDPRQYLRQTRNAMEAVCADRFERFGAAGHACKIKPMSRDDMARRYVHSTASSDAGVHNVRQAYC